MYWSIMSYPPSLTALRIRSVTQRFRRKITVGRYTTIE